LKANIHDVDKLARIILAIIVAVLYFTGVISGMVAVILAVIAAFLVVTVFINFCPFYHFLGISTKKKTIQSQKNKIKYGT
jgi:zinc transporter ZupT